VNAAQSRPRPVERAAFEGLLVDLRPRLHRYCSRMTGSVIDGEDAVQDALTRAVEAFESLPSLHNPEGWIFRIAHNAALDALRRRMREEMLAANREVSLMREPKSAIDEHVAAEASLLAFMSLPVSQRSCVILMDVLGYSLNEIQSILDLSLPAIKASLHRGRERLRALAAEPADPPVVSLAARERTLLEAYVDRFNARDFDAVRDMLAEEVRLEVVARASLAGKDEVAKIYFGNYADVSDWYFVPGLVEGRPAMLACDPEDTSARPKYFVLLAWEEGLVKRARDFRHASYAIEGARIARLRA